MDEIPPFLTVSEINSKEKGNPPPKKNNNPQPNSKIWTFSFKIIQDVTENVYFYKINISYICCTKNICKSIKSLVFFIKQ
jgi:hypothetical protein